MKLNPKIMKLYLLFLLFLNLTFRYFRPSPGGGDTWAISVKATVLLNSGKITWLLHPLSLFGWYPYSYPTGMPSFVAAFQLVTGLSHLNVIYLISLFVSLLLVLVLFK